jgi:DNA-binding NarL/FixJ family response regulator
MSDVLRVVTVDDERDVEEAFREVFGNQPDVNWIHFLTREEATFHLRECLRKGADPGSQPDLIVLDVQLGDEEQGGLAVLKEIGLKGMRRKQKPWVIMLSVSKVQAIVGQSLAHGAMLFLWKGGTNSYIVERARAIRAVWGSALKVETKAGKRQHNAT